MLSALKKRKGWSWALGAGLLALTGSSAVQAASAVCSQLTIPFPCNTPTIASNSAHHYINLHASMYAPYKLIDSTNGIVVTSGTAGFWGTRRTITGLYAKYHGHVGVNAAMVVSPGSITISND